MLYYLLYEKLYDPETIASIFRVFKYITLRTAGATLTALFISFLITPWIINRFKSRKMSQVLRVDHHKINGTKSVTPTMGGISILIALTLSAALWSRWDARFTLLMVLVTIGFGWLGFLDDYLKLIKKKSEGLVARYKFIGQVLIAGGIATYLYYFPSHAIYGHAISIPFTSGEPLGLGWFYIPFVMLVIVGTSNAVNLTDGMDGLAIGAVILATIGLILTAYLVGHYKFAEYLKIIYIQSSGEITVYLGAMLGASIGFLWYNAHPAQIFMGDTGALSLGGILGTAAVLMKSELLLLIIGGLFAIEALSVMIQVASFKFTGHRVFAMAPIHHHFELKGWSESKVVVRFWIIAGIFLLIGLSTFKLR
ncbi:phospho-N-acetylmuramoyl-pentapeptide-transferase [Candidatus Desantisbacteria bacterium CG_4_9_14_3_um_filter_40_11]|uniref:Phospho-N-acetylmuramoyl-pentapeptide-transferase n=1 Tax=Candidatus Desantisbacteria bacterium CG_4_9_14_3_um_filter_40_11 TaxID=1974546 RepID=A0A2M8AUE5_9BACT|nr:MAG: phospho-N-acetylmuramoyl-pentapeptide-transferase [Candidatus Desantisbacteria bacterium CG_4_9_14_3_um_filter_40_11]